MFDLRVNRKPTSVRVDGITILKRPDGTPYNGGDFDGGGLIVNQTFESLAVSRDGLLLFAGMEGPLSSDGTDANNRTRNRIIRYVGLPGHEYRPIAQYASKPDPGLALVELAWVSPTELVSMERTFTAGVGNTIRVFIVSLRRPTDVTKVASLADAPETVCCCSTWSTARRRARSPSSRNRIRCWTTSRRSRSVDTCRAVGGSFT